MQSWKFFKLKNSGRGRGAVRGKPEFFDFFEIFNFACFSFNNTETYKPDTTVGGQFLPSLYNGNDWDICIYNVLVLVLVQSSLD